jgi:hypothetical protein
VAGTASQHDVARVQWISTILQFDDVVAEQPNAGTWPLNLVRWVFASATSLTDDQLHQPSPFDRQVEGFGHLCRLRHLGFGRGPQLLPDGLEFHPLLPCRRSTAEEQPMADDLTNRGPADRARINVHEDHEVRYWTKELGCTAEQLRAAVKAVGVMAADVRAHLKK